MSALTEHLMDSIQYLKTKSEQLAAVVDTLTEDIKSLTADNADLINQRSQHLRMLKQRERKIDELLPLQEAADEQHIHLTEDLRETRRKLKDANEWNEVSSKGLHTMINTRDKKIAQLRLDLCDTQRQLKDTKELRLTPDHRDYWNEIHSKGLHTMTDDRDKEIAQLKEELETHKKMIVDLKEILND